MAFLKFVNETITYPYDTKSDYPYTGFPKGSDYPEFDVFWVYPVAPDPPANNSSIEGTPVFNAELNRWEQTWIYNPIDPPPEWTAFNTAMLSNPAWLEWASALTTSAPDLRNYIVSVSSQHDAGKLQDTINLAKTVAAIPSPTVIQSLADTYHIPLVL